MIIVQTEYFTLAIDMPIPYRNAPNLSDMVRYGILLPQRGKRTN